MTRTALAFAFAVGVSAGASAGNISTSGALADIAGPIGHPETQTIGQTFTTDATQVLMTGFTLYLRDPGPTGDLTGNPLTLRGFVATWDAANSRAGTILYTSGTRGMPSSGAQQAFAFAPGLILTPGETYVAFLSIAGLGSQPDSSFGMPLNGDVTPGHVVYQNGSAFDALTTLSWVTGDFPFNDAWFEATFLPEPLTVPAPAGLGVFGIALASLGLAKRRWAWTQAALDKNGTIPIIRPGRSAG